MKIYQNRQSWTCALEASCLRRPSSYRTMSNRAATSKQQSTGRLFAGGSEVRMSNAMDNDISCAACAAPVFLPHQPEARSGTWRLRQQQPLTQEWLRKCRRRSSSRSSACRQARDEQRWAAFASRLVVVARAACVGVDPRAIYIITPGTVTSCNKVGSYEYLRLPPSST